MLRLTLIAACCLLTIVAAAAHAQPDLKIEPYTGPPVYLADPANTVPATRVESKVMTSNYESGKVWIERGLTRFSDNSYISNGAYREFYPDGQQFVDGQYDNGEPVGEWTYWHPNGQLAKKLTFKAGQPDGSVELYREDGTLDARKSFAQGKRDGKWVRFDATGEKKLTQTEYADGKPVGVWEWWFESGQKQREASFEGGLMSGVAREWSEDGVLRAEVNFKEGKRHGLSKQWTIDGRVIEQLYENGAPVVKAG